MTASTFTTVMTTMTKALCLWSLLGTGTALEVVNNLNHQREGRCAVQSPGPCPVARCPPTPPGCSLDEDTLLVNERGDCCPALCRFVDASGKECRGGDAPASLALYPNPELTEQPRQLGSGIQFEDGLTDSEKAAITRVIEKSHSAQSERGWASCITGYCCPAKVACFASTCWIPIVGLACAACEFVKCDRRLDFATEVPAAPRQLGSGIQFEDGLTDSEKAAIARVIDNSHSELRGSSCLAKTACFASTCWIPFVGIACLACEAIKCDRRLDLVTEVPAPRQLGSDTSCLTCMESCLLQGFTDLTCENTCANECGNDRRQLPPVGGLRRHLSKAA